MSNYYVYITRIIPALSVVSITVLLLLSLKPPRIEGGEHNDKATTPQLILSFYTVFLHALSIVFPARVCWAIGNVIQKMKASASFAKQSGNSEVKNAKKVHFAVAAGDPLFLIIIPTYKEEVETLEETLKVLASHPQALHTYHIYLAMEKREQGSASKAASLVKAFRKSFHKISYTLHPSGIEGEAPGKSSNESWAARQAFQDYSDRRKNQIYITIMDADTHLSQRYFSDLRENHINNSDTNEETIYLPPLVFDRNINKVPTPVKTADIMWAGAGISSLYEGSAVCIPTSVYSLTMTLAERVGGWDTGPGAIGEDMHMYLKCFFALSGKLKCKVIYAAASQCNVSSDMEGFWGYLDGLNARYKQALRHMWGAMDSGYAIRQSIKMISQHCKANFGISKGKPSLSALTRYVVDVLRTSATFGLNLDIFQQHSNSLRSADTASHITKSHPISAINVPNVLVLFHRLFEAHFLPTHLGIILTVTTAYQIIAGPAIPTELALALNISGYCRFVGWSLVCLYFYRYAAYHRLCVDLKREEMREAGLLSEIDEQHGSNQKLFGLLGFIEAASFPIGGFIFGAIPACQAVLSHVFTDRLTYHVSLKPLYCRAKQGKRLEPLLPKPLHTRDHSNTWLKQAASMGDHLGSALALSRPVKRED